MTQRQSTIACGPGVNNPAPSPSGTTASGATTNPGANNPPGAGTVPGTPPSAGTTPTPGITPTGGTVPMPGTPPMTGTTPTVGTPNAPAFPTTTGTGNGTTGPGIPGDMSGMNMEHALDTLYVPPLVDDRVFSRFRRAVQAHAGSLQRLDEANAKLRDLRDTLQNLCDVASVCRLAARGEPRAFCRAHDELECIAIDFPDNPLGPAESGMGVAAPNDNWQLAAALDLFAGAAFVSKGDTAQLTRYVTAIVRAIEMAVAFPLAFADESACFLGESAGAMPPALARRAIANATRRLLSNDTDCTPAAPARFTARLETLARRWIKANPVTALFDALTGPTLDETAITLRPSSGSAGGVLTLSLGMQSVDPASLVAMFTPHVPANIVRTQKGTGELYVVIPAGAHSGHVAVVQRRGADQFTQVNALVQNYEADFEAEWMLGVFSFIPLQEWCYPIAF